MLNISLLFVCLFVCAVADEEVPEVNEAETKETEDEVVNNADEDQRPKQSRVEKKARRLLQKLGMKSVPGVARVTVKKSKNVMFGIAQPDVYKLPSGETYVVFGEAKMEDLSAKAQRSAAQQFSMPNADTATDDAAKAEDEEPADTETPNTDDVDAADTADGVEERDVELVMQQAGATRTAAIEALKKNNGDIVNAIMELSA